MPANAAPIAADDIIRLIHKGPLEEPPWKSFVRALRARLDVDMAAIALRPGRKDAAPVTIFDRRDAAADHNPGRTAAAHRRLALEDPLNNALTRRGGILTLSEVMSREELVQTRFYTDVIQPSRIDHQIGMAIAEPSGWRSHVGMMNAHEHRDFGARDKAFLQSLQPHFEIALETYARLVRTEAERNIFGDLLDRMAIAAFVLDQRGRIIRTNNAAGMMMREGGQFIICNARLSLRHSVENERLQAALRGAIDWCDQGGCALFADVLRAGGDERHPLGILVRGVPANTYRQHDVAPGIIVYASQSKTVPAPGSPFEKAGTGKRSSAFSQTDSEALVVELFALTHAEARVAVLLAGGLSLNEIAKHVGITEKTARSYSKRAYQKVGVSRQADLVRLLLTSVAVLG